MNPVLFRDTHVMDRHRNYRTSFFINEDKNVNGPGKNCTVGRADKFLDFEWM